MMKIAKDGITYKRSRKLYLTGVSVMHYNYDSMPDTLIHHYDKA